MRRIAGVLALVLAVAAAAAGGGYWFAQHQLALQTAPAPSAATSVGAGQDHSTSARSPSTDSPGERRILYYKDPMGKPEFSATPKKDSMGMDYLSVYEDEEARPASTAAASSGRVHPQPAPEDRKVLYYRNPMGLPDTSPAPKKDSMGMDYIPVYEDEGADDGSLVTVSPARVQMLGVRTQAAALRSLKRPIHAVGTLRFSERQIFVVSARFEGWIERLLANATGETVRQGQPLMRIYSPLLVQTEQEYVEAARMATALADAQSADEAGRTVAARLVDGALQRLRNLDVPKAEIERLTREQEAARTVTWPSPFSGIVLEKTAVEGMRFMPGEPLYRIAGTSPIWVIADIFEQDLAQIAVGQAATVTVKAYPARRFQGRIAFIDPSVGTETRTGRVRIELPNPTGELKADMYADVEVTTRAGAAEVLSVPDSAVIDNGLRQVVLIERGQGRFEPRPVRTGAKADGFTEIREGVKAGEHVVVSANFLIDAESNLKAALGAFTTGEHQQP